MDLNNAMKFVTGVAIYTTGIVSSFGFVVSAVAMFMGMITLFEVAAGFSVISAIISFLIWVISLVFTTT